MSKKAAILLVALLGVSIGAAGALAYGAVSAPVVPSREDALRNLQRFGPLTFRSLSDFDAAHGVRGGSGTEADPFLISDLYTPAITMHDVPVAVTIRHVYVSGKLALEWTGPGMRVEGSTIGFLDTNPNQPHATPPTWGDFAGNRIGDVILRHTSGNFEGNDVGSSDELDGGRLVLDVQGYHGLRVANNTIRGPAEFRLHGHCFASSWDMVWMMRSHEHGATTERFNALIVEDNLFVDPTGRGVDVSDYSHPGNDRYAISEPDPALNGTHRHHTYVQVERNEIRGSGLVVTNPNAGDPRHLAGNDTRIHVGDNVISDPLRGFGVRVESAHGANVAIEGGSITMPGPVAKSQGVILTTVVGGSTDVRGVTIAGFDEGVRALTFLRNSPWSVTDSRFVDVGRAIVWDSVSVKTAPTLSGNT